MPIATLTSISDVTQVGAARRAAGRVAQSIGLGDERQGQAQLIAVELSNNLLKYARNGRLFVQGVVSGEFRYIDLIAIDSGPGMSDPSACMRDGYSSGGTPGTGLGAIRRMSSEFDIYSQVDAGTVVACRVSGARASSDRHFHWGTVCIPCPSEEVCGDAWHIAIIDGVMTLFVVDGLGHGPFAADAAALAINAFEKYQKAELTELFDSTHQALIGSRGAAAAAARIAAGESTLRFLGVGNIGGTFVSPAGTTKGLVSHNGTLGVQYRKGKPFEYPLQNSGLLVMYSDGVQSRWSFEKYPGLLQRHPSVIAGVMMRDFVRGRDDATVAVVRYAEA